jgi:hypothetical protein
LPKDLAIHVAYELGETATDPQGLKIDQLKLLIRNSDTENECEVISKAGKDYVFSATQILRTKLGSAIDTSRYRGNFVSSIHQDKKHVYHANYLMPDCAGPSTTKQIALLQEKIIQLR